MEKLKQKTTAKIHQTESIRVRNSKSPPKTSFHVCRHRSEFNTYIRLHPPKHLPEDERSFSRNVASLKNMIQDKTNCSSESIQHTESTNLNIFREFYCGFYLMSISGYAVTKFYVRSLPHEYSQSSTCCYRGIPEILTRKLTVSL